MLSVFTSPTGGTGRLSFLRDVEVHARFLVTLPVLIGVELLVHLRIRPVVRRFVERRIVKPQDLPLFETAIESGRTIAQLHPSRVRAFASCLHLWPVGLEQSGRA